MIININSNLTKVAKQITTDYFGDEVETVARLLGEFLNTAEEFGVVIEGRVPDMFGGEVPVTAFPTTVRHEWSF